MMKLFGNSKRSSRVSRGRENDIIPVEPPDDGKIEGRTRAVVLLGMSVLVFAFALVMIIVLINRSKELDPLPTTQMQIKPIEYEVNAVPTQPITQGEDEEIQIDLKAPESVHQSSVINILLLGVEKEKNDTAIIVSVNLAQRTLGMLSIPRDTYVAGDYEIPKMKSIYGANSADRRIFAVKEAVKGMFGFETDYYFLLDESTLREMVKLAGGVPFDVPASPAYHNLKSGQQTITEETAFGLFQFRSTWTDVETDPPKVQREFLLTLLEQLLKDKSRISEHCVAISQVAQTDLSLEELAYLAYLLADFDFDQAFSRALPGGEKEIDDQTYYEVDPEAAVELINENINPLNRELTVYHVNFRQEQGDSGEGEFSDYGHPSSSTTQSEESSDSEEETDEDGSTSDEEETDPEETESDSSESEDETDPPETDSSEPTEEQTQPPAQTESTQAQEP